MIHQLDIDQKYYNNLDIEGFSQMMKDPSFCYKFYWLEAIVQLISEDIMETSFDAIIDEMKNTSGTRFYRRCIRSYVGKEKGNKQRS